MSAATGSFMISDIYALDVPLLPHLPFLFIALGYALTIKLAKSPFDIASCHHGHQEIVRGVLTDYSGPQLALLEISHWLDVILLLGLCSLFWHTSITGMVVLLVLTYCARNRRRQRLRAYDVGLDAQACLRHHAGPGHLQHPLALRPLEPKPRLSGVPHEFFGIA